MFNSTVGQNNKMAQRIKNMLIIMPLFILPIVNCIVGENTFWEIITYEAVFAAITEELIFRGLLLWILKTHKVLVRVIVTSVLFSMSHSINILNGYSVNYVIIQVLLAFVLGTAYALCVIKYNNLIPAIVSHIAINVTGMGHNTITTYSYTAAMSFYICVAVYIVYDLFLYNAFFRGE